MGTWFRYLSYFTGALKSMWHIFERQNSVYDQTLNNRVIMFNN